MTIANIFCDGATLGHNGKLGTVKTVGLGVYCECPRIRIAEKTDGISNNEAEFKALICGMEEALALEITDVHFFLDSKIVVRRAKGLMPKKINRRMDAFQIEVISLAMRFNSVQFHWIPREQNQEADLLSKRALKTTTVILSEKQKIINRKNRRLNHITIGGHSIGSIKKRKLKNSIRELKRSNSI